MALLLTNEEGAAGILSGARALQEGVGLLDALELVLRSAEADPLIPSVGRGGAPNAEGTVELDASIMDGSTLRTGGVGALRGYLHPISVARRVMDELPHELLVGEGASHFAAEMGFQREELLTPQTKGSWDEWLAQALERNGVEELSQTTLSALLAQESFAHLKAATPIRCDTAIVLGRDKEGHTASAASTSGWPYKYPGRLGDSPIVGAGHYAHDRYGMAACTHTGEMNMRCSTARATVLYLKMGLSVEEACLEALSDLEDLSGGFLDEVVIQAVDCEGRHYAVSTGVEAHYWLWREGQQPQRCAVDIVEPES